MIDVIPEKTATGNIKDDVCLYSQLVGVKYRASGNLFIAKAHIATMLPIRGRPRSAVSHFSVGCGIRMRRYLRECRAVYKHMVTLTYPNDYPTDGARSKEHLRRYLQEVRRWDKKTNPLAKSDFSAFWFLEFQERGAPHYHIFLNRCPPKDFNSSSWYRIVNSEDEKHLRAGTRTEFLRRGRAGTISYASKYAAKAAQKSVPADYENVGRFWGVCGDRIRLSAAVFVSRDAHKTNQVKNGVKELILALEHIIKYRCGRVFKREEGLLIVILLTEEAKQVMLRLTQELESVLTDEWDIFQDAECW